MLVIETNRLCLREFNVNDFAFVLQLLNTKGWIDFIGDRGVHTEVDAKEYITNRLIEGYKVSGFGFYLVELKESKTPIGMCGLVKRSGLNDVDLGFAFLPEHHGFGFAKEASESVIVFAKDKIKLNQLAAITVPNNIKSIQLLKKLNFEFEDTIQMDNEELMLFTLKMI